MIKTSAVIVASLAPPVTFNIALSFKVYEALPNVTVLPDLFIAVIVASVPKSTPVTFNPNTKPNVSSISIAPVPE